MSSELQKEAMNSNQSELFASAMGIFAPPEKLTLSEWAKREYVLESGRFVPIPFQIGMMDAFTDPVIEEITLLKSARVGCTEIMVLAIAYYSSQDPLHIGLLQPTADDCRGIGVDKIAPTYARVNATKNIKFYRNTITHKTFPGGSLKILPAKSPRNLRRHDLDVVLLDEIDGYESSAEGNPINLAVKRTLNSARKKIMYGSTPINMQTSEIYRKWLDSDQRYYKMPCPHCGAFHTYDWDNIRLDGRDINRLKMEDVEVDGGWRITHECPECGEQQNEGEKKNMVAAGDWVATAPFAGHAGFFINTIYSPFPNASWPKLALEYLRAKRSPDTHQTFINTVLGLPFSDHLDKLDEDVLYQRRIDFSMDEVPDEVLVITAGVDIQKDRAEITYLGWSEDKTWTLAHEVVYGDPTSSVDTDGLWARITEANDRMFNHELGGTIGVSAIAVDSGNWTTSVYDYCANGEIRGLYAIKGTPGARPLWTESKIRPGGGKKLYNVGVESGKTTLMQRLTISDSSEPGYIHFNSGLDREYFDQLLSEFRKVEYVGGKPKFVWERKVGRRAEALDCWVYASAARQTLVPNWSNLREEMALHEQTSATSGFAALGAAAK